MDVEIEQHLSPDLIQELIRTWTEIFYYLSIWSESKYYLKREEVTPTHSLLPSLGGFFKNKITIPVEKFAASAD